MMSERVTKTFWAHVRDDGGEDRWTFEPITPPTLRVDVIRVGPKDYFERTRTRHAVERTSDDGGGVRETRVPVTPRGSWWTLERDEGDHSVWRRPHYSRKMTR
jgi:hypothetical protein